MISTPLDPRDDVREALREVGREFTRREVAPYLQEWEDAGEVPRALHRKAAEHGLLGIAFPEKVGGEGGDLLDSIAVQEAMFEEGASSGLMAALFTSGIALPHLAASGDQQLIERFVRPTLAGELIGSLAVTEPGGGSDVAGIRTTARLVSTGSTGGAGSTGGMGSRGAARAAREARPVRRSTSWTGPRRSSPVASGPTS